MCYSLLTGRAVFTLVSPSCSLLGSCQAGGAVLVQGRMLGRLWGTARGWLGCSCALPELLAAEDKAWQMADPGGWKAFGHCLVLQHGGKGCLQETVRK